VDKVTEWSVIIGVIVAITISVAMIERLFHHMRHKRRLATLDNYGRDLSGKEIAFLEDSYERLLEAKDIAKTYPKWYGWFLALAYVPLMLLGFAICFWLGSEAINFLSLRDALDEQILVSEKCSAKFGYLGF